MDGTPVIESLYAAALRPWLLPTVLDDLARTLDVPGAVLVCGSTSRESLFNSSGLDQARHAYLSTDIPDPREARARVREVEGFRTDFDHFTSEEVRRDPFYQEFLRPQGLGWHAVACLAEGDQPVVLSLKREWRRGPFTAEEVGRCDALLPHLRMAMRLASQAAEHNLSQQLRTIEQFHCGAILLDGNLRVLEYNARVPWNRGLSIRHGQLRCTADAQLQQQLGLALAARGRGGDVSRQRVVVVKQPQRAGAPLLIDCCPLTDVPHWLNGRAAVMVLVREPDRRPRPPAARLRDCYGLSPREAQLAVEIAGGQSIEQAAERMGISTAHARTRLKGVFAKLGVRRQSELVLMLAQT